MTRAEEMALKVYPIISPAADTHEKQMNRYLFERAYSEGEKDTIERAVKWLTEHLDFDLAQETLVSDFRKAMEE